jgi:hypothetical protein
MRGPSPLRSYSTSNGMDCPVDRFCGKGVFVRGSFKFDRYCPGVRWTRRRSPLISGGPGIEGSGVVGQVVVHDGGDEVVAVIVAGVAAQGEALPALGAGRFEERIGNSSSLSTRVELSANASSVNYLSAGPRSQCPPAAPEGNKDPEGMVPGCRGQIGGPTARSLPAPSGWKLVIRGAIDCVPWRTPWWIRRGDVIGQTQVFQDALDRRPSHHDRYHAHAAGAAWARQRVDQEDPPEKLRPGSPPSRGRRRCLSRNLGADRALPGDRRGGHHL